MSEPQREGGVFVLLQSLNPADWCTVASWVKRRTPLFRWGGGVKLLSLALLWPFAWWEIFFDGDSESSGGVSGFISRFNNLR